MCKCNTKQKSLKERVLLLEMEVRLLNQKFDSLRSSSSNNLDKSYPQFPRDSEKYFKDWPQPVKTG